MPENTQVRDELISAVCGSGRFVWKHKKGHSSEISEYSFFFFLFF